MGLAARGAAMLTTALALLARVSAAQKAPPATAGANDGEQVRLVYEASPPGGCPSQAEFEAEVAKLTNKAHFTQQGGARRVRIELENRGGDLVGRLVTGDGKNQSSREVRGKKCREVSSALAIAVALTIDPEVLAVAEAEPAESEPKGPTPTPETPTPRTTAPPTTPPAPVPERSHAAPSVQWGLGVGLTLESAWSPQMRPGGHAFALFALRDRLRVSLGVARFFEREVDATTFGAWFGQASVSWNLAVLGTLRPYALIGYEVGVVSASGSGLATSVSAQRPWQAAQAGLGLRFETDEVFLQLGGSLLVPVSRQRYLTSDSDREIRLFFEVPRFGLKQETSLGVFL